MQKIMVIPIYGNKHINAKDNKMDKYISAAALLITFLLSACYNDIYVFDIQTKKPISDAMVLVKESNMLYPNSASIYFTDSDGAVRTNEFGNLLILAGKDGYWLATDYYDRRNTVYLIRQSDNPLRYKKNTPFPAIINAEGDIQNSTIWNNYCFKQQLERKDFFIKQNRQNRNINSIESSN